MVLGLVMLLVVVMLLLLLRSLLRALLLLPLRLLRRLPSRAGCTLLEPHQYRANVVHGTLVEGQLGELARGRGQVAVVLGKAQAHEVHRLLPKRNGTRASGRPEACNRRNDSTREKNPGRRGPQRKSVPETGLFPGGANIPTDCDPWEVSYVPTQYLDFLYLLIRGHPKAKCLVRPTDSRLDQPKTNPPQPHPCG